MELIAAFSEIEKNTTSIFLMNENCDKQFLFGCYSKNRLFYAEGSLSYVKFNDKLLVIPARHYLWIPAGIHHSLAVATKSSLVKSIFFPTDSNKSDEFYKNVGIYAADDFLIEMIGQTALWQNHIMPNDERYGFLQFIKNRLPQTTRNGFPVALPFTGNMRMQTIISYMEENLADKHTLQSIGSRFNASERTLSRFFKDHLKISFLQYLKHLRIVKAFEFIQQKKHSLGEIACMIGYQSLSSFSYTFYQVTGKRPSAFVHA